MEIQVYHLQNEKDVMEASLTGQMLLETPLMNQGSVFPEDERRAFGLLRLLPYHVESALLPPGSSTSGR